ncbi:hypothetical protein CR513_10904, partial [Mucuna pruriens]
MKPNVALKIKEEVKKQWNARFLTVANYPQWVANIVPVPEKDGKVRMCVNYRDMNRASPKENFPFPHIDVLIDNIAQHTFFSFIDSFSRCNQILMALEDKEKTTFITLWGTFCYKVMSFGLKNVGATYQRAMVALFHDMMHKEIKVYVDDMIAKSKTPEQHIKDLRKLFIRLRKYKLRLSLAKCTFGKLEWDSECQEAFEKIKRYLENPLVLVPVVPRKPLILYLTDNKTPQEEKNKPFITSAKNSQIVKRVYAAKRLRQYMLSHTTWLIAKTNPIKYIFEKPALTGWIAQWQMALSEYDIIYVNQKSIKGSALAEHLAYHPLVDSQPLLHEFPDEHIMTTTSTGL